MIDITGIDKIDLFIALYENATSPIGSFAAIVGTTAPPMTRDRAEELIQHQSYFDYVGGRVMKIHIDKDELNPYLYDRDNGEGAAARAIDSIR